MSSHPYVKLLVYVVFVLNSEQDKGKSVTDFMDRFGDQWNRVYQMTSGPASTASYRKYLRLFLEQDYAKRDSLLAALSHAYPNPVDNLTNLSYEELRCHIPVRVQYNDDINQQLDI